MKLLNAKRLGALFILSTCFFSSSTPSRSLFDQTRRYFVVDAQRARRASDILERINTSERILSFHSDAKVEQDGNLLVTETIEYINPGVHGLHGVFRDFPTRYKDKLGNNYNVRFEVKQVLRDGVPIPYGVYDFANGKRIQAGDPGTVVPPGKYTYTIEYETNRQLGFFDKHDELYWNVTGNGWFFPIDHASAQVQLPEGVPADKIKLEGFTGYQDDKGKNYTAQVDEHGNAVFVTTKPLLPEQGLTIVVGWPKGFVKEPSWLTKALWFLKDNFSMWWLLLGLLLLFLFYRFTHSKLKRRQKRSAIIPLFEPPEGLTPGAARYISHMKYDPTAFAADIVNLAVHGWLTIQYKPGTFGFGKGTYTLEKTDSSKRQPLEQDYNKKWLYIMNDLLGSGPVELSGKNQLAVYNANELLKSDYRSKYSFFDWHGKYVGFGWLISWFFFLVSLFFGSSFSIAVGVLIGTYAVLNIWYAFKLKMHTNQGRKLYEQIEGFKMFLGTTESERMKMIGTPPTKTPELYEKYLPYAIALGVEEQWTEQFAPVFEKLAQEQRPYRPVWYYGPGPFNPLYMNRMSRGLSRGVTDAYRRRTSIASSGRPPGGFSGFGGRGSSGGGGGGGGGGSW